MPRRISLLAAMLVVLGGLPCWSRADEVRIGLPDDVKFVVSVDLAAIQNSAVGGRLLTAVKDEALGKLEEKGEGKGLSLDKIVEILGFDPFEEIQSVVVAAADYDSPEESLVGCIQMRKTTGNLEGLLLTLPGYSAEDVDGRQIHSAAPDDDVHVYGAIHADADEGRTVVLAAQREAVVQLLDSLAGKGASEGAKTVTLSGEGGPLVLLEVFELPSELMEEEGPPANVAKIVRSISVRISESEGKVVVSTSVATNDAKQAEQLEQMVKGLRAMVDLAASGEEKDEDLEKIQQLLTELDVARSDSTLDLSLSVPADEALKLIEDNLLDK